MYFDSFHFFTSTANTLTLSTTVRLPSCILSGLVWQLPKLSPHLALRVVRERQTDTLIFEWNMDTYGESFGGSCKRQRDKRQPPIAEVFRIVPWVLKNAIPFILLNNVKILLIRISDTLKVKCIISFFLDACQKWNPLIDLWKGSMSVSHRAHLQERACWLQAAPVKTNCWLFKY